VIKEIEADQLKTRLDDGDEIQLLDIRSAAELAQGVLPDSQHVPMHLIPLRINDFAKDKAIVLYCRSGARSYHACSYLAQQGIDNVINLRGGIIAWARHGYPIDRP